MKIGPACFNAFLLFCLAGLGAACHTPGSHEKLAGISVYMESIPDGSDRNGPIVIGRSIPIQVNVDREAFLTEKNLKEASVVETNGLYSIELQFDQKGTWLLEQYSIANRGRRAAVLGAWGERRWLGAPRLERRISDGVLVFTPDATREEAVKLVEGLNRSAKEIAKGRF
jgi:hypothetical protein